MRKPRPEDVPKSRERGTSKWDEILELAADGEGVVVDESDFAPISVAAFRASLAATASKRSLVVAVLSLANSPGEYLVKVKPRV